MGVRRRTRWPGPARSLSTWRPPAVNRADLLQRQGHYPPPPGASEIIGLECSGHIAALGEGVTGWQVGDEVCALLAGGGYAEQVAVPAPQLLPVPDGLDLVDGGGAARGGVHGVVERRDGRPAAAGRDVPRPGRRERHRHARDPGGQGARGARSPPRPVRRTGCSAVRELGADIADRLPRRRFRPRSRSHRGHGADVILDNMGAKGLAANVERWRRTAGW